MRLRQRFVAGLTLMSFISLVGAPAFASGEGKSDSRFRTEAVSGKVLYRGESGGWQQLSQGSLDVGTSIRAGQDGQAVFSLANGSRIRLAPNTEVRVTSGSGVELGRGRLLGRVDEKVTVSTARSETVASQGTFVLETTDQGSVLRVLNGNARLSSKEGVDSPSMTDVLPEIERHSKLSLGSLSEVQVSGDVALLGEFRRKGKGKGVRQESDNESVGGETDASPDQDVRPPQRPEPPAQPPEQPPVQPPAQPPAQPPVSQTPPPAGGGTNIWPIVGGLLLIGGIVALVSGDDDTDNPFVPGNPGVPSPSLP